MTKESAIEDLPLSRPYSEFLVECKRRYTAVQPHSAAQREAEERERARENRRRLQILRAFR